MKSYLPLILIFSLVSCETVINVDPPSYQAELATTSYFSPDSTWSARISQTIPAGEAEAIKQPFIETANVTIWSGTDMIDHLIYDGKETGRYVSSNNLRPKVGIPYTIKIEADGFSTVEATSMIPAIPRLSNGSLELIHRSDENQQPRYKYKVRFRLRDLPGEHYYSFSTNLAYSALGADSNTILYTIEELQMDRNDPIWHCNYSEAADPVADWNRDIDQCPFAVMTDRLFREQHRDFEVEVSFYLNRDRGNPIIILLVNSMSKTYFEHKRTVELQDTSSPFSEPTRIYSNFKGGRGIFAGYATSYLIFDLSGTE